MWFYIYRRRKVKYGGISLKSIMVTGGAGFIGSHLCEALLCRGRKVINIDSFNDYYDPKIKSMNVRETEKLMSSMGLPQDSYLVYKGDIRDMIFLNKVFEDNDIDSVIHLAAYAGVRPSIQNPVLYTTVNINGTVNILECLKKYGIKKYIFASSSSVYGNNKKVPFSEDDIVDYPISIYAATKKAGELICHAYYSLYGINTACLRFFTVYGPRQRPDLAIHKFTKLMLEGKTIPFYGDGTTMRDYTYIDDIIDGILKALDWVGGREKRYGVFNFGRSDTVSLAEMLRALENALGLKAELEVLPLQPGDVDRTFADISKSKSVLGYEPHITFADGIARFVEWYKKREYYIT
jgi:UDP-glucuronate 4-epimerase